MGNAKVLERDIVWNQLIHYFLDAGLVMEGPVDRLHPTWISLNRKTTRFLAAPPGQRYLDAVLEGGKKNIQNF